MWNKLGFGAPSPPPVEFDKEKETALSCYTTFKLSLGARLRVLLSGTPSVITTVVVEGKEVKPAEPMRVQGSLTVLPPGA